jgi:predicted transcriptional regulator
LPAVYYLARQIHRDLSGDLIDYVLLLWLYSNPHETRRRTLASLRHILKHIPEFQRPDGKPNVTEEELNQIVFAALKRMKEKGFATINSQRAYTAQISLTEKGIEFIQKSLSAESLQFLEESGHMT